MDTELMEEYLLPLEEFVKLPTTVDFQVVNTDRFQEYAKDKPYLRFGKEFSNDYIIGYTNERYIQQTLEDLGSDFLSFYPKIMSPVDAKSNEVSGITQVLNQPFLNLTGRGVIIGIVDTGIDYTKEAFKFEDGSTKILNIWDQTLDGPRSEDVYFGSTYGKDQIDVANRSENPYDIVPSFDEDGHGTFLASVAASNEKGEYIGAAPAANIISVKLRRARKYYIDRYLLSEDYPNLYESTDYLLGIRYIQDRAEELDLPVVFCVGMGSNSSAHDGNTLFENYISFISQRAGFAFVTAGGNEANANHHTQGKLINKGIDTISIKVGQQGTSFSAIIFGASYDKISMGITSPTGEKVSRVPFKSGLEINFSLIFENTEIYIKYFRGANTMLIVGFQNATQGIWDITLFGDSIVNGDYYAWLPITGQVDALTEFLRPVPDCTIIYPATALRTITCGAYSSNENSLYVSSSWGPTRLPQFSPDFVAPGVSVQGIYPTGYGTMTGTSVAAAITAGAAAILLEWGIVNGNRPYMNGELIKALMISGATRSDNLEYPNTKWGFGKLDLFQTFTTLKETNIDYEVNI